MAVRTALTLTQDQVTRMCQYAAMRISQLQSEKVEWDAERKYYADQYEDNFDRRRGTTKVFEKSNKTLNIVGSGADTLIARLTAEAFGTRPFIGVDPVTPSGDQPLVADAVQRHLEWKITQKHTSFPQDGSELLRKAVIYGVGVSKIAYQEEIEEYEVIESVLFDRQTRKPVIGLTGDYIYASSGTETLVNEQAIVIDDEGDAQLSQPADRQPEMIEHPVGHPEIVLGRIEDGRIEVNDRYEWQEQIVTRQKSLYSGARAIPLHYKEFLCPMTSPSIHQADFVAHVSDMRLSKIRSIFNIYNDDKPGDEDRPNESAELRKSGDLALEYVKKALDQIKRESATRKNPAIDDKDKQEIPKVDGDDPTFRYVECYFQFDARETGRPQRIFLIYAIDYNIPIFWDYIQNVTPDGEYPFEATRIIPKEGSWVGIGFMEKYAMHQGLIDTFLNQFVYRNELASNPVKFRRREAVEQWMDGQPMKVDPDTVYDLTDGFTASTALSFVEIPKVDQETKYLLETTIANWRTRSGISTATQGEAGGTPAEKTATGVTYIAQSADIMLNRYMREAKPGLEASLRKVAKYQYTGQTAEEVYQYNEGDESRSAVFDPQLVRDMDFNVTLTLTSTRQTEQIQRSREAIDIYQKFLEIPDMFKAASSGLFNDALKNIQINNAETYTDGTLEALQQQHDAEQDAAQAQIEDEQSRSALDNPAALTGIEDLGEAFEGVVQPADPT